MRIYDNMIFPILLLVSAIVLLLLSIDSFNEANRFEAQRQRSFKEFNDAYIAHFSKYPKWIITAPNWKSAIDYVDEAVKKGDLATLDIFGEFQGKNQGMLDSITNNRQYRDSSLFAARVLSCSAIITLGLAIFFLYRNYRMRKKPLQST